jgi:flagellar hook-associated protein 2
VLSGLKTGSAYAFSPTDDPSNQASLVAAFGIGVAPQVLAKDATMQIDGTVTVTRSSNTISDAIPGLTISLGAQGTSTVTVSRQDSAGSTAAQAFVDAYNAVQTFVKKNVDDPAGPLARDAMLRTFRGSLTDAVLTSAATGPGAAAADMARLSSVGISIQKDGTLKLDSTAWNAAYPSRISDVQAMLSDRLGAISSLADDQTAPYSGQIDQHESALSTQSGSLQRHIDDINSRLDKKRTALLLQYSRSEAMLGQLKAMGDSLGAQITSLAASTSSSS